MAKEPEKREEKLNFGSVCSCRFSFSEKVLSGRRRFSTKKPPMNTEKRAVMIRLVVFDINLSLPPSEAEVQERVICSIYKIRRGNHQTKCDKYRSQHVS